MGTHHTLLILGLVALLILGITAYVFAGTSVGSKASTPTVPGLDGTQGAVPSTTAFPVEEGTPQWAYIMFYLTGAIVLLVVGFMVFLVLNPWRGRYGQDDLPDAKEELRMDIGEMAEDKGYLESPLDIVINNALVRLIDMRDDLSPLEVEEFAAYATAKWHEGINRRMAEVYEEARKVASRKSSGAETNPMALERIRRKTEATFERLFPGDEKRELREQAVAYTLRRLNEIMASKPEPKEA